MLFEADESVSSDLLAFGNIGITVGLFLFRMAYFVLADDMVKSKKD